MRKFTQEDFGWAENNELAIIIAVDALQDTPEKATDETMFKYINKFRINLLPREELIKRVIEITEKMQ